ncbi:MAG: DUF2336 domain-containing protein [Azospirillum sp.]|jgi:uncharacterized protein (DUF2336 family)|nr:DUF2336 domain-containing protein [Azospirillum sp.]MCA3264478.1 DUF2336 domain-containing protein [Azospirillum sp.]MCZ8124501.1 DUF2336 domain-containing protein [Magnetospirillum sp.]
MDELIQKKIQSLLAVARTGRGAARATVGNELGEILADVPASLDRAEYEIAADIVRRLIRDIEADIKLRLAERLAETPDAPKELVVALANDEIDIARPLLTMSAALADEDLIEIVRQRGMAHRLAIAGREEVSATVAAALVDSGDVDVMRELLDNRSARIAEATYAYLAELSRERAELQRPLVGREDLPGEVAARLYGWVAADLKRRIRERHPFDAWAVEWAGEMEWAIEEASVQAAADHAASYDWGTATDRLADAIQSERLNDPAILVKTLRQGHVSLFEAIFARLAELPIKIARRVLYQQDGRALAVAGRALGMERAHFLALGHLVRRTSSTEGRLLPEAEGQGGPPEAAVALFDRLGTPEALGIVKTWRERPSPPSGVRGLPWARRVEPALAAPGGAR